MKLLTDNKIPIGDSEVKQCVSDNADLNFVCTYLFITGYFISVCLIGYDNDFLSLAGKIMCYVIIITYLLTNFLDTIMRLLKTRTSALYVYLPLMLLAFWVLVRSVNVKGLFLSLQFALILLFAIAFRAERLNIYAVNKSFRNVYILLLAQCAINILFVKLFENNNYLAVLILLITVLCYVTLGGISRYFVLCFSSVLLILAGSRAVILSYLASLIIIKFILTKSLNLLTKWLIAISCFILIIISMNTIYELITSAELSTFLFTYTGKRAETGRFEIWYSILSNMSSMDYLVGMGGGLDYASIIGEKLSPHSGYVYILSSYGLIGLALFIMAILICIKIAWNNNNFASVSLMLTLVLREFFETTLIHNNFPLAIFFWGILTSSLLDNVLSYRNDRILINNKEILS